MKRSIFAPSDSTDTSMKLPRIPLLSVDQAILQVTLTDDEEEESEYLNDYPDDSDLEDVIDDTEVEDLEGSDRSRPSSSATRSAVDDTPTASGDNTNNRDGSTSAASTSAASTSADISTPTPTEVPTTNRSGSDKDFSTGWNQRYVPHPLINFDEAASGPVLLDNLNGDSKPMDFLDLFLGE